MCPWKALLSGCLVCCLICLSLLANIVDSAALAPQLQSCGGSIRKKSQKLTTKKQLQNLEIKAFLSAGLAGAISCALTHASVVPLDVIKTRIQSDAQLAEKSMGYVINHILKTDGRKYFLQGLGATISGYFMQGFCKFGFYDLIKTKMFAKIDNEKLQQKLHLPVLIASSAMAETIASWALCPMEMTRLFMVTNPSRCSGMLSAMGCIIRDDGVKGLFKGLPFIMMRQIPYTCAKLVGYDIISDSIKSGLNMTTEHGSNSVKEVLVHLSSGIAAGVLAATISQPADVLLSKTCGKQSVGSECLLIDGPVAVLRAFRQLGVKQSFAGLKPRAVMVGTLTAMQFAIYEATKIRVSKSIDRLFELNDNRIRSNNDRQDSTQVSPSGNSRDRKNQSQTGESKSKLLPKVQVLKSAKV